MKPDILSSCIHFLIWLQIHLAQAAVSSTLNYGLHSQCKSLSPAYDEQGNLKGYSGICDVDKWNGTSPSIDSLHKIDPKLASLQHENYNTSVNPTGLIERIKYKQPKDQSLFDWMSPHHDIIRNHPHYRHAHLAHNHCIHKAKTGLFDFLSSFFSSNQNNNSSHFTNFKDPYSALESEGRCLDSNYYTNNPLDVDKKYYDPFALHLGHKIHHVKSQLNQANTDNIESLKENLQSRYNELHRHLDCHCHHESPQSKMLNIHHHPIKNNSISIVTHPNVGSDQNDALKMHSSVPLDPGVDMEDEHMNLIRMARMATQHAYNLSHFNENLSLDDGALRMEMFHPINPYMNMNIEHNYDPEWNRLKVEKVIVIKRIKVPVVKKVSVPIPVPVPYPIPTSSNASMTTDVNQNGNYGGSSNFSQYSDISRAQPGYMGNNTYMIDTIESQPEQMNSIVRAISGYPCGSSDNLYRARYSHSNLNQLNNQYYNGPSYYANQYRNGINLPYQAMEAHTMIQPGLQLYPNLYSSLQPQYRNQYCQIQNLQPSPLNSELSPQNGLIPINQPQVIFPAASTTISPQNQAQGQYFSNNINYK